ncbi:MAG: metal ABC transporter permease [Phycisphaerae bacterium]|nr:metal ABC transporter permease [Phycisphaerae bacterium]MDW8262429.1 iron chelate uptake ABC transporter family permease subunit [Phycisphaerales bacterium]
MISGSTILGSGFESNIAPAEALWRFATGVFDDRLDSTDCVLWGAVLLGVACGVLGSFVVLRRQSLLGDAIGHAVLPGVVCGFLAAGEKSTPALMLGALAAGLLAAGLISLLSRTTVLKSSECMGAVFTGFYAIGIVLIKRLQNLQVAGQTGLERFLFGQIVGISTQDLIYMGVITAAALACVVAFWRMLAVTSFDREFAASTGVPAVGVEILLTTLLTLAIVVGIQAVGVVLVAAMLVTPAATAYLLTDRLHRMVALAGLFGAAVGVMGILLSLLLAAPGRDMPTGPTIVLTAGLLFGVVMLVAPRHGVLPRLIRLTRKRHRTAAENLLRTIYLMIERRGSAGDRRFGVDDIAALRHETPAFVKRMARHAARRGWIDPDSIDPIILTDLGLAEARKIVRNHRLWELFLTQEAHLAGDHVHADAEYIEHLLPPEVVQRLERLLQQPAADPHGRPIPASANAS